MSDIQNRIARLSLEKRALLEGLLRRGDGGSRAGDAPGCIEPVSPDREPVLSFSQERFWFLNELDPDSAAYNVVVPVGFRGPLDVAALERALNGVVARHQTLRSCFRSRDGKPVLEFSEQVELQMPVDEMPGLDDAARSDAIDAAFRAQCLEPFDLASGPLLRARMLRFGDELHVLLLAMHHIVTDEWSFRVLFRELSLLYQAAVRGAAPDLEPLAVQYADYAAWQREQLTGEALERQLAYWCDRLEGVESQELPHDRPRPPRQTFHAGQVRRKLPRELSDALRLFGRSRSASLFMTLLCGFTALLGRYSSQSDVVVASAAADRESPDVEGLIGFFVNTLALRTDVSDNPTLEVLLERVKENTLGAYAHQSLPFEKVVEALGVERDASRNPIAQVAFTLQNRAIDALEFEGLEVFAMTVPQAFTRFDLELFVRDDPDGFAVQIVFSRDLFSAVTIERMLAHYERVLEALVTRPEQRLGDVELVVGEERREILERWNDTATDYPHEASIVALFEEQAARRGDAIALEQGRERLSYQALDQRANRVARHLVDIGVRVQEPVGLCFERSMDMVVAVLGILKAGAVYVPLDPDYPLERLGYMLEDAGAEVLVQAPGLVPGLSERVRAVVELDGAASLATSNEPVSGRTPAADDLAYVMYTSGSTGRPKGVCVDHRCVVRLVRETNFLEFSPDEVFLQFAPISFDAATLEIWGSLLNGARLVLAPAGPHSLAELAALLEESEVSVLWLTAALFHLMVDEQLEALRGVRQVLAGGEALSVPHVNRYLSQLSEGSRLVNGYGPTENTTFTCCHVMVGGMRMETRVPIGRPISNTRVYVLDGHGHPVPVGVVGELHAAGDGLARGYWRRASLTEQVFVCNTLPEEPGERLYRTGDLVRWRHDGVLEFVGRRDHQVKVRGHRIELGEVETALASQPEVREAVVLCREDSPGDKRLAGYVVLEPEADIGVEALRARLRDSLPAYMVPSLVMALPSMPLTPVGKLDRAALPAPADGGDDTPPEALGAAQGTLESRLAAIWREVLSRDDVGHDENFFEIGGHSLLATQVVSRVRNEFGPAISLRDMFANATVSSMAMLLRRNGATDGGEAHIDSPPITPVAHSDGLPLSYAQERLWFLWRVSPRSDAYNIPLTIRLTGALDSDALGAAFDEIVSRHASLRTRFVSRDGAPVQLIAASSDGILARADLSTEPQEQRERLLARRLEALRSGAFDLERGPLLRAELLRLDDDDHVLALVMQHIVTDGWSLGVLFRELSVLYRAFSAGKPSPLPSLPLQYPDYAVWQRQWLVGETLEEQLSYWQERLEGAPVLALPTSYPRADMQSFAGARVQTVLGPSISQQAGALAQAEGTTLFMTLLTGFVMLLEHYTRQDDIVVGSPIANRTRVELEGLVGFFVNMLALRVDAGGAPTFRELLARVRETALGAYAHQDVPFEKLVESLQVERDPSRNPLFQVVFQLQDAPGAELDIGGVTLGQIPAASDTTRFDLECHAWKRDGDVSLTFIYNAALFDEPTVARMLEHYCTLLVQCIDDPELRTRDVTLLTEQERRALVIDQPRQVRDVTGAGHVAPRTELEETIASIWCEVLGRERIGVGDNFFDLGGHSLLLMRAHAMLERALERTVPVVLLFRYPTSAALASHLEDESGEVSLSASARARVARARAPGERDTAIAIVGMAGRFPGARDVEAFWRNLAAGEEAIRRFSAEELRAAGIAEEQVSNPGYVPARGSLDDVDLFDAAYFNYPPREAELLDPQQRLFLECAHEALDSAGYDPKRFAGLIGVYAGSAASTYLFNLMSRPDRLAGGTLPMQLGNDKDFLATRASYKLNLRGPSINVQTACSTSLVAVHEACRALIEGECDMALAGAVNVTAMRVGGYTYVEQGILSPDGHCRAFDADACGTVPGEGVGVIVLKRLDEALRDRDVVHAVVLGTAINNDGDEKVGFTAPSVRRQAEVIALSQAVAGVEPESISYIEAHGTGTSLGDPIEVEALNMVFADGARERCAMGSVKSNIGHLDAAAGIAGLIKTVLALKHAELPPSLHFERPNPEIRFEEGPFEVSTRLEPWLAAPGAPRRAGINSFGIGGTNAHVILEEAPRQKPSGAARDLALLVLSARTARGLDTAAEQLAAHLEQHPDLPLADVSYTLRVGRREHEHRRVVVCRDHTSAIAALRGRDRSRSWTARAYSKPPAVVFMFPGQGTQYPGMGRELYDTEPVYRDAVDRCAVHLSPLIGRDLRTLLFPAPGLESQCADELKHTSLTQPALFVTGYALARLLVSRGVEPDAMIGHSIGELTAACVSGALTLEDALTLVAERGRLMEDTPEGAMLAVSLDEQALGEHLGPGLSIAAVNAPRACVVSGAPGEVAALEQRLSAIDVPCQRLHTRRAFHCELMDGVLEPLTAAAGRLRVLAPRIRYLSNVSGGWIEPETLTDPGYWSRQVRSPVRFSDAVATVLDEFPSCVLLEVGPGGVLSSLVRQQVAADAEVEVVACLPHAQQPHGADQSLLSAIGRAWQRGAHTDWSRFDAGESRARVELPAYPFERKRFWVERKARSETAPAEPVAVTPARKLDIGDWFQVPSWQRGVAPPVSTGATRNWLLFADAHGIADELAARLAGEGHRVSIARPGNVFADEQGGAAFTLRMVEALHYRALFDALDAAGRMPDEVVHLWSVGMPREPGAQTMIDACFHSPLLIAQALGDRGGDRPVRLLLATDAMQRVLGDEPVVADKSLLAGPVRVIGKEFPNIVTAGVDLRIGPDRESVTSAVEALLSELSIPAEGTVVAYRNAMRWTQTLITNRVEAAADAASPRAGSVVLITGGLGGVGLALAERFAGVPGARLVLVQRSAMPSPDQWDSWLIARDDQDRTTRRIQAVRALERLGAEVMVASADVADAVQMGALVDAVRARFGRIDGVIHAAGVAGSGLAQLKDREMAETVLRPKVMGARVLVDALADAPPEFLVLCSSLYALTGGVGQIDYTAANAFLDALALELEGGASRVVSIGWDAWRDVGMVVDKQRDDGLAKAREESLAIGISAEEGREVLARALSARLPQLAVSPREARAQQAVMPARTCEGEVTAKPAPVVKRRDTSSWLYAPSWQRLPLPATERKSPQGQCWLVLGDDLGIGDGLVVSLLARQADVIRVAAGSDYRREHDGAFVLRPGVPGDFDALLRELRASDWSPDVVVHLWGITGHSEEFFADGQFELAYHSLSNLLGAIARERSTAPLRLEVVADQVQDVSHADVLCPAKSAAVGLLRCAPLEMPALRTRHVDIEIGGDDRQRRRAAALLHDELCSRGSTPVVAHRGGYRWVQAFTALPGLASQPSPLKDRGVYLITGGLGRIGLTLARFLARTRDARLVLVSRGGLPPRDQWAPGNADLDARTRARIDAVESIEAAGGEVMVVAANVAQPGAFPDVLDEAEARFGVIDGVFHCAADLATSSFVTLDALDRERGAGQFEAKVRGTLAIVEAIDDRPGIGFCVLMSSISTVLGGIGFGAYAAANAVMESIAARCAAGDTDRRFCAVAWDGWQFDQSDAAAAPLAMTADEGMEALSHALAAIDLPRMVVSTADLHARISEIAGRSAPADNDTGSVEGDAYERPELDQDYVAPRDDTERRIAGIWADLLGIDRVGVHDDFLELGGHSLLATQMLSRLRDELGAELTLAAVFTAPTVAELADRTREQSPDAGTLDEEIEREVENLSDAERESLLAEARREAGGESR